MPFQDSRLKLVTYILERVPIGDINERALARRIGISQPHAHNVRKGVRTLSPQIADFFLNAFHLPLPALASFCEIEKHLRQPTLDHAAEDDFASGSTRSPGHP